MISKEAQTKKLKDLIQVFVRYLVSGINLVQKPVPSEERHKASQSLSLLFKLFKLFSDRFLSPRKRSPRGSKQSITIILYKFNDYVYFIKSCLCLFAYSAACVIIRF